MEITRCPFCHCGLESAEIYSNYFYCLVCDNTFPLKERKKPTTFRVEKHGDRTKLQKVPICV